MHIYIVYNYICSYIYIVNIIYMYKCIHYKHIYTTIYTNVHGEPLRRPHSDKVKTAFPRHLSTDYDIINDDDL